MLSLLWSWRIWNKACHEEEEEFCKDRLVKEFETCHFQWTPGYCSTSQTIADHIIPCHLVWYRIDNVKSSCSWRRSRGACPSSYPINQRLTSSAMRSLTDRCRPYGDSTYSRKIVSEICIYGEIPYWHRFSTARKWCTSLPSTSLVACGMIPPQLCETS